MFRLRSILDFKRILNIDFFRFLSIDSIQFLSIDSIRFLSIDFILCLSIDFLLDTFTDNFLSYLWIEVLLWCHMNRLNVRYFWEFDFIINKAVTMFITSLFFFWVYSAWSAAIDVINVALNFIFDWRDILKLNLNITYI